MSGRDQFTGVSAAISMITRAQAMAFTTVENIEAEGRALVMELSERGAEIMFRNMELAVTRTGLKREELYGGHPGRIVTGSLTGDIAWWLDADEPDMVIGKFGWKSPQTYYMEQDQGFDRIPPALAMHEAFLRMQAEFLAGVRRITEAKGARYYG